MSALRAWAERTKLRPTRPNPLIATRTDMGTVLFCALNDAFGELVSLPKLRACVAAVIGSKARSDSVLAPDPAQDPRALTNEAMTQVPVAEPPRRAPARRRSPPYRDAGSAGCNRARRSQDGSRPSRRRGAARPPLR